MPVFILCACGTLTRQEPPAIVKIPDPIVVKVTITQPCVEKDQLIPLPDLLIGTLTAEDIKDPGKVVQYYVADVEALKGVVKRQSNLLNGCVNANPTATDGTTAGPAPVVTPNPVTPEIKTEPTKPAKPPRGRTFEPPPQ